MCFVYRSETNQRWRYLPFAVQTLRFAIGIGAVQVPCANVLLLTQA